MMMSSDSWRCVGYIELFKLECAVEILIQLEWSKRDLQTFCSISRPSILEHSYFLPIFATSTYQEQKSTLYGRSKPVLGSGVFG